MFVGQMVWKSTVLIEKNKKHFKVVSLYDYIVMINHVHLNLYNVNEKMQYECQ